MVDDVASRSAEVVGYDAVYRLRRSRSTMADDAVTWVRGSVGRWMRRADPSRPFRILSIGCGDGSLDVPLLVEASRHGRVEYVGCDVNAESLAVFATGLAAVEDTASLATRLVHGPFGMLEREGAFDLVLLAHVLYYVDDPLATVRDILDGHVATDGRAVIIHSAHRGVPAMVEAALGRPSFVTGDQIASGLGDAGLCPAVHVLPGRLCIDDAIVDSPLGRALLGFIVERDPLDDLDRERLVAEMVARSVAVDGALCMPEDLMAIELRVRLRPPVLSVSGPTVDPIRDYHVLAEAFDWPARLNAMRGRAGAPPALLDVGCGTGRWLRVLASTFPALTAPDRRTAFYDRIDPSSDALGPNAAIASALFDLGDTWCEGAETAAVPVGRYDLIWSVHALYGVSPGDLDRVLHRLIGSLADDGVLIVVLGDPGSFYIEAKPRLVGGDPFTSSRDVLLAAERLGVTARVSTISYSESFPVGDEDAVRRYVWHESIGNSYLPAGLSGDDLPGVPEGEWWESHRSGDRVDFPQSVSVIVISSD